MQRHVLAVIDNLFFASKLEAAARRMGFAASFARGAEEARQRLLEQPPDLLVVALSQPSAPWEALVRQAREEPATRQVPILAFGKHTDGQLFKLARQAGCDLTVTNAQFSEQLGSLLARLLDQPASAPEGAAPDPNGVDTT